eukprot:2953975-Prorocentrum_lima.AAC.1
MLIGFVEDPELGVERQAEDKVKLRVAQALLSDLVTAAPLQEKPELPCDKGMACFANLFYDG